MLYFNDTSTRQGIIQAIERRVFPGDTARISGSTDLLADFTAEVNLAKARYQALVLKIAGTEAPDDFTHTKYPIIYADLTAGQQDYPILNDQEGSQIIDIYKLIIRDSNGNGREIYNIDVRQLDPSGNVPWIDNFYNGNTSSAVPQWYSRTANGIFFQYAPNYTTNGGVTGNYGIEAYISREPLYYMSTDTMKLSGFPGVFDDYLAIIPSWKYAMANNLSNKNDLTAEKLEMENNIEAYYGQRVRDRRRGFSPRRQNNR